MARLPAPLGRQTVKQRVELALVEPLRTLRMICHSAWIAERWSDPAFPIAFPWFASAGYWSQQATQLREQIDSLGVGDADIQESRQSAVQQAAAGNAQRHANQFKLHLLRRCRKDAAFDDVLFTAPGGLYHLVDSSRPWRNGALHNSAVPW